MKAKKILAASALMALAGIACAQAWPSKPITIIVPFAAGGGTDVITRSAVQVMGRQLGTSFVVDNKPGGNSFIGAQAAARAPADGYTFFMTSLTTHSINPWLFKSLPYALTDFVPVGYLVGTSPVLFAAAGNPAVDLKAVVASAKARTDGVNFAIPNSSSRFATLMFGNKASVKIVEINFNSTPQAHSEVASGRVDYIFGDFTAGSGLYEAKKIKPIAIAGPRRLGGYPNIPTMAEAGLPGVEVEIWVGLFAPKGTPAEIVQAMNSALNAAVKDASVAEVMRKGTQDARPMSPAEFGSYVDAQYQHWGTMSRAIKIQAE